MSIYHNLSLRPSLCKCLYIRVGTHIYIYICIFLYTQIHRHLHIYNMHIHIHTHTYIRACIHTYIYMYTCRKITYHVDLLFGFKGCSFGVCSFGPLLPENWGFQDLGFRGRASQCPVPTNPGRVNRSKLQTVRKVLDVGCGDGMHLGPLRVCWRCCIKHCVLKSVHP